MSDQPEYQDVLRQQFRELRSRLRNVDIALWANDYQLAHSFLDALERNQQDLLDRIAELKNDLLDIRKQVKNNSARTSAATSGASKKWQSEFIEEYTVEAQQTNMIRGNQLEYELVPLQHQISRYRQKINEALGNREDRPPSIIPDNLYEYRLMPLSSSDGQVKYRIYRFAGQIDISPSLFIERIGIELGATPQVVSGQVLERDWSGAFPLWLRLFSDQFFIELTIFDHSRAEISVTAQDNTHSEELVAKLTDILKAA